MKVICGVDGSANSFEAVRFAARLLSPTADQVALYCTPPEMRSTAGGSGPGLVDRAGRPLAEAIFEQCRGYLPPALASRVHTIVGTERPQRGLLAAADEWGAEMIVVGARGVGPIERLLLGSVSSTVAQSARVPVLVIRESRSDQSGNPLRVLMAYDGSDASRHATELLGLLSWPSETHGLVMTVCEPMLVGQIPEWLERERDQETEAMSQVWVREHEDELRATHDALAAYAQQLPSPFRHEPLVAEGDPAEEILKTIDREQSELVVVEASGMGMFERWLLGSTSQKVLNHAPCSVLIVRQAAD